MSKSWSSRAAGALLICSVGACGRTAQVSSPAGAAAPPATQSVAVTDGESLIRAMHAKYSNRWPRTVTYTQTTSLIGQTGANNDQSLYQALSLPGKLRIDYGNPDLGNGLLYRSDSSYQFANGRVARATAGFNELLLLTHDVYHQAPEVTVSVLRSLGYQMSRMRTSSFD